MGSPWEMDWETTPEKVDAEASARNSKLEAGYYRAKVIKTETGNEKGEQKFTFQVTHGPNAGRVHFESLDNPRFAENEKRAKAQKGIAETWAARLQCIPPGTIGRAAPDWVKAVGKEMIIRISVRKWTSEDKKTSGEMHEIGWSGLWPLEHDDVKRLKNDVRESLGLPTIAGNDPKPAAAGDTSKTAAASDPSPPTPPPVSKMAMDIFG